MEKILESNDFIDQELLYSNWLSGLVDIMEPKDAFLILGRATAKTSDFLARLFHTCQPADVPEFSLVKSTRGAVLLSP